VKKVVNTVFDREISQGGLSSDIDGIPIIPDIESNNDFSYTSNLYFGIAGVLSRILIDSMLEFSGEYGIIPSVDTNISPQLWRVQMLRSFFNRTIVLVQIFLCLLAIIFTAYCIYHSAIWRDKII
jgi:hypothetical protein